MNKIQINDTVYYKYRNCYIKYIVKKIICDNLIIVNSYHSKSHNCIPREELFSENELFGFYKGEKIYE